MTGKSSSAGRRDSGIAGWLLALIFVCLAAGIVAAGRYYYRNYERHYRSAVERQLSAIADLKVDELAQWRQERLGDGAVFFRNASFSGFVRRLLENPEDAQAQRQIQAWVEKYQASSRYDQVRLLDAQGVTRLSVPAGLHAVSSSVAKNVSEVLRSGQVTFQDFYRGDSDQEVHLAVLVPMLNESDAGHPLGVLVLRIDPATYLYPFIQRWPTPSLTAETLLVRREGNAVVFLNELRFQKNTALTLRRPLDQVALPAARAALKQEGIMEGKDYRGVPVVAALRIIPDSPWSLVARIDAAEVFAPLRAQMRLVVVLISALLVSAGAGVWLVWWQQRVSFYRKMAETENKTRRMATVVRDSNDAITIQDFEGRITAWNHGAELMYGYSEAEALQMNIWRITPPAKTAEKKAFIDRLIAGEAISSFETQRVTKDGRLLDVWLTVTKLVDDTGKIIGIASTERDITARKRAEEEASRMATVVRDSNDAITIQDFEGKITAWNRGAELMYGYSEAEALAANIDRLTAPGKVAEQRDFNRRLFAGEKVTSFETRRVTKDGHVLDVWLTVTKLVDEAEKVIGIASTERDITARKQAEEALRESESRFRQLAESLPQLVWTCQPDGPCDYLNRQWVEFTGVPEAQQHGFGWLEQLHPDDRAPTVAAWEASVASGSDFRVEFRIRRHDGEYRWFDTQAVRLRDAAGHTVKWFGSNTDMTERKRAEEEIRKLNAELEQRVVERTAQLEAANKELESFSYSVSHDLRAPLRHVQGYVDMLAREAAGRLSDQGRHYMTTITDASREMGVLIDDLLAFSRMGRAEMVETMVNLDSLVQDTLRDLEPTTRGRNIVWKIPSLPAVRADPAMLKLALTNLLGNAVKFTRLRNPAEIEIGCDGSEGERVIVFVRDNGVGFDPQYAHKLFGVFQRLHRADEFEGTGIGLANVRRTIARLGGRVWAEGRLNAGATFYFTLKPSSLAKPAS